MAAVQSFVQLPQVVALVALDSHPSRMVFSLARLQFKNPGVHTMLQVLLEHDRVPLLLLHG
jgi:hypothetical protein